MKIRKNHSQGTILLTLIVTITVVSVLSAVIISIRASSAYQDISTANYHKARYMAESGIRYSRSQHLPDGTYLTVREDGSLLKTVMDPAPPAAPAAVPGAGFHLAVTDCKIVSTGVVNEGGRFESSISMIVEDLQPMPCWKFDSFLFSSNFILDSCGTSNATIIGSGWSQICDEEVGGALHLDGSTYLKTDFTPDCAIGDSASFTVTFWARPQHQAQAYGAVVGVSDLNYGFGVGIDEAAGKWVWKYGEKTIGSASVIYNRWQKVIFIHNADANAVSMYATDCETMSSGAFAYAGGTDMKMPEIVKELYIGAENRNGFPEDYYTGDMDEILIYYSAKNPADLLPVCVEQDANAYYPFSGNTLDESHSGTDFDASVSGDTVLTEDRFGCSGNAYAFDGVGDYITLLPVIPPATPTDLVSTCPFSVSAWVRPSGFGAEQAVLNLTVNGFGDVEYGLLIKDTGEACLRARDGGPVLSECAGTPLDPGKWAHIAAVFFSETERRLYVDGVKTAFTAPTVNFNSAPDWLTIGWGGLTPVGFFSGSIDEVAVFDDALTDAEVEKLSEERPED